MDDTEFTGTLWYTFQEQALTNFTIMWALITIAAFAWWPVLCVSLIGAL